VDFLPGGYLETKSRRRSGVIFGALFGVIIGGVIILDLALRISIKQLRNQQEAVEQKCVQANQTIEDIKNIREEEEALARHAELAASLLEKLPRSSILSEIGRALPADVSLVDLNLNVGDRRLTPDATVELKGLAASDAQVTELVTQLNRSKLFSKVTRPAATTQPVDGKMHEFQLEMALNTDADVSIDLPQARSETVFLNP
jgi:Tfp pilus assembly protein PilN